MRHSTRLDVIKQVLTNPKFTRPVVGHELRGPVLTLQGARHGWTGTVPQVAEALFIALYGRPVPAEPLSPLARADAAKRARDIGGEIGALVDADHALASAPWYPVRPGDLVHVHYEQAGEMSAFGETYIVGDAEGGLMGMQLLAHTLPDATDTEGMAGCFAVEAADDPLYEAWFEAGPQRLTIVRDGRVVHNGGGVPVGEDQRAEAHRLTVKDTSARYAEELRRNPGKASADGHTGWECGGGASLIVRASTPGPGKLGTHHGVIYACAEHQAAAEERIEGAGYVPQADPGPAGQRWDPWPCGHVTAYKQAALAALTAGRHGAQADGREDNE